jgi:putative chitinase
MSLGLEMSRKYKGLLNKYGVNTPLRLAHFFAQVYHESGLKPRAENLNYSYQRLLEIFEKDFDTNRDRVLSPTEKKVAEMLARKPQQIANFVYAHQNGNGSVASGDGWRFRGRGFIQITGRDNYRRLSEATGIDYLNNPDWLLREPDSMLSALWFWSTINGNAKADRDDVKAITKAINGGYNGLADRIANLNQYKKVFK